MASRLVAILVCSMALAVAVQAHPGRKMQQLSQQLGNRATVAHQATSDNIHAAIDNNMKVRPSQTPKLGQTATVRTPTMTNGKVTSAISSAPKSFQGASGSTSVAAQSATGSKINEHASGAKYSGPTRQPPKVTTAIANAPKSFQTSGTGLSTAAQSATSGAIHTAAGGH